MKKLENRLKNCYLKFTYHISLDEKSDIESKALRKSFFRHLNKKKLSVFIASNLPQKYDVFKVVTYYDEIDGFFESTIFYKQDGINNEKSIKYLKFNDFDHIADSVFFDKSLEYFEKKKLKIFEKVG